MLSLTLELIFIALVIISLIKANFSDSIKAMIFGVYIVLGVLTKTIWFPVIVWIVMWVYFTKDYNNKFGDD